MPFDNIVYVYNKSGDLLATFQPGTAGLSPDAMRNLMVSPTVHIETNGLSTLEFQMLANSEKWQQIKGPENRYFLNNRYYTALSEGAFEYSSEEGVSVVNATLMETWYLLDRKFNQAYNCGIYCYAKATFQSYTDGGAIFKIQKSGCSNAGDTITNENAWQQVINWTPTDDDGNKLSYSILTSAPYAPTKWEDTPSAVFLKSFSVSGSTITLTIMPRVNKLVTQTFEYAGSGGYYYIDNSILNAPSYIKSVKINYTTDSDGTFTTSERDVSFMYQRSNRRFSIISYSKPSNVTVNAVIAEYEYADLGNISSGATCTFAYGAEVVDEHTFIILPKAKTKYKLTIDGVAYDDSQVKDSRGAVLPRGSGGYAMWAALKNSGWTLGVCDVIAKGFNPQIDYGVFNVESDMKDVLTNVQNIQSLYGGILDWDSEHQILNYRAENSDDYQSYEDGFNRWKGYEFREGKNMISRPVLKYDNNIITRAYVLGYGNLNIKSVNGGKSYVDDFSYTSDIYEGYLEQELIYDTNDECGQNQLLYWGKKELAKRCRPQKSITIVATDLRTTVGYEHEVFDINDVVRVHYQRADDGEEVTEDKRVILWEYNAFAMFDCVVELGDKTQNLIELFRLVYKKTESTPSADASGKFSTNNIKVSPSGSGNGTSLSDYIEYISRTTTRNSDAIAQLVVNTNSLSASAELFAQYKYKTDTLLSETYAGLTLYADQKSSAALLSANTYTEQTVKSLNNSLTTTIADTRAELILYTDQQSSSVQAVATGYYNTLNNKIGPISTTTVAAGFTAEQNARQALASQFSSYQTTTNNRFVSAEAAIETNADAISAQARQIATLNGNVASVRTYVDQQIASIDVTAQVKNTLSFMKITNKEVIIYNSPSADSTSLIRLGQNIISISTSGELKLTGSSGVYINGTDINDIASDLTARFG